MGFLTTTLYFLEAILPSRVEVYIEPEARLWYFSDRRLAAAEQRRRTQLQLIFIASCATPLELRVFS